MARRSPPAWQKPGTTAARRSARGKHPAISMASRTVTAKPARPRRKPQNSRLTLTRKSEPSSPPSDALIVYRLGQEILNLQSGVRFPVGAPFYEGSPKSHTDPTQKCPGNDPGLCVFGLSQHSGAETSPSPCREKFHSGPDKPRVASLALQSRRALQVFSERPILPRRDQTHDRYRGGGGQDGLVANTLNYLNGQPLIGVNPE